MKSKIVEGISLLAMCLITDGCTVTRLHTADTGITSYTVAWPWLDTSKQLDKACLTTATNAAQTIDLTGFKESESGGSNAVVFAEKIAGAVTAAAVKAAKP